MELAKRRLEDKLGLSQNPYKYCSCIDCQESKIVGFRNENFNYEKNSRIYKPLIPQEKNSVFNSLRVIK